MHTAAASRDDEISAEHEYLFQAGWTALADSGWARSACRDADPDLFFPISALDGARREAALDYCARCPVRHPCLRLALQDRSLVGIWGGTDEDERAAMRRAVPAARERSAAR